MVGQNAPIADHRAHARREVLVRGRIRRGGAWMGCEVVNVSAGGARLRAEGEFAAGEALVLELQACGEFVGEVAWARDGELGMRFTGDPADVACALIGLATYG
jgi:hypothetical protein